MSDGRIPIAEAYRVQLERNVGPVRYSDLRAHLDRDAVFLVAASVSLVECGVAIAMDDVVVVKGLIDSAELRKPSQNERASWAAAGGTWTALVVQPFVLVQLAPV
jgi:hypothetical protein